MSEATEVADDVRRLYTTVTREGQSPVAVTVTGNKVTVPAWVLVSLLHDKARLQEWEETHYEEMEEE